VWVLDFVVLASIGVPLSQAAKVESRASWTFIVYLDADNNLDAYAPYSLGMMQEVGSTSSANVVVLWDGYYQPAYMYKVVKDGLEEVKGFSLNGQEVNMGDSATLKTFVDYALSKFSADHYVLVLWNHGNDVSGVCWDEHPDDHLTHPEVTAALSKKHIDILAFDACLMAMIEVAYEYSQYGLDTDYLVGSENYVPVAGYPYNTILASLNQNPAMTELEAAQMIVHDFAEFYKPRAHFNGGVMATLSAIDIDNVDKAVADLAVFTQALMVDMEGNHDMVSEARGEGNLPWSEYGWDLYIDLPTFVEYITLATTDSVVNPAGKAVLLSLSEAIVALGNTEPMESAGAKGMGIWFPASYHMMWGFTTYQATKFASQGWLGFLYAYWNDYHR
jgi:hypothetical protein